MMDGEALKAAMDAYGDTVLRLCTVRLGNLFDAQDVFQEVFLSLYRTEKPPADAYAKAWLIRCACNACTSFLRKKRPNQPLTGQEEAPRPPEKSAVYDAVMGLPEKLRSVIYLFYYEELPVSEIAQALNMTPVNVRVSLHRGREKLKEKLEGEFFA